MIAEAIDTAYTIGWAILAWIVITSAFGTLALYAAAAITWTVARGVWRVGRAACRAPRKRPSGPSWARGRLRARIHAHRARKRHSKPTDAPDYQEAA